MAHWFTTYSARSASWRRAGARLLGALLLLGFFATLAPAAPEYALSGQTPVLASTILAQTPNGPISALDVLMFDDMTEHAFPGPVDPFLDLRSPLGIAIQPVIKQTILRMVAMQALAAQAGDWRPADDELYVKSFSAASAVWIEKVVKPQVKVLDRDIDLYYLAHSEKYLGRRRAQVRYIFKKTDPANPLSQVTTREGLEELARQIQAGKISFEAAARKNSDAPSAAQGGLIPIFENGTHFLAFEDQTFRLEKPGQLSAVFEGPLGYYLIQLVKIWPPYNTPVAEVRDEIRARVRLEHLRHYFNYLMATQVYKRHIILNNGFWWGYLSLNAPIDQVDKNNLERLDYLRYFENPTSFFYEVQLGSVLRDNGYWVEGQTIMEELAAQGLANDPLIQRARMWAELPLKAQHLYAQKVAPELYRPNVSSMKTILSNKQFARNLRSLHLVQFDTQIKNTKKLTNLLDRQTAEGLAADLSRQLATGVLPTVPPIKLADWLKKEAPTEDQLDVAITSLEQSAKKASWNNISLKIKDMGWQTTVPGSAWHTLLKNLNVGQVSPPQPLGTDTFNYLVVGEKPADLKEWANKPLLIRTMAFQIEAAKIFYDAMTQVQLANQVKFTF